MPKILKPGAIDNDKFERSKRLGWFDLDKVSDAKLLVVGTGALGNEVCKNLVLSGYRNITIVDMDYVIKANLNRCLFFTDNDAQEKRMKADVVAERLKELSEDINIITYTEKIEDLGEDFIRRHDMVIGCLDNIAARLHLNVNCYYYKIPYVDGGTLGMSGKVQVVIPPSSCIQCGMNKSHMEVVQLSQPCTLMYLFSWNEVPGNCNSELIKFLEDNYDTGWVKTANIEKIDNVIRVYSEKNYILLKLDGEETKVDLEIDDGRTATFNVKAENGKLKIYAETIFFEPKLAAEITTTSIIAAVQVREALKITNELNGVLAGKMFYYDGIKNTSEIYEIEKNPECGVHSGEDCFG